ncbi:MAG TPA: aspartate carbamoyltransferase catalytic subunit, partial [Planctomycetota bacterium]|nr:aspartate carbamoyltransferase catalytic subunit [Planctomycetota bacterium]
AGPRHLVSIDDLSLAEIRQVFAHARAFAEDPRAFADLARGYISASLFYEPSTRTRLSFESAMLRLGGGTLTAADMKTSSAIKGESLADTVRVVQGYADVIVLRHPSEGASRLAAQYADVPVVNAGDGSHEHPTQTLCDLYTLWIERGRIEGLDVVLSGDLRYSRTIHSFIYALARFGANVVCVPHQGLELPEYVLQRLRDEYGAEPQRADVTQLGDLARESDAVYLTPQKPHQLSLFTEASALRVEHVDAVYVTRPQTERSERGAEEHSNYMRLGQQSLQAELLRDAVVMHPLPRRDEISSELDADPRSIYFKQAARGVPIRMAILAVLLGRAELDAAAPPPAAHAYEVEVPLNPCPNRTCISRTEERHVRPAYKLLARLPLRAACGFCEQELPFAWVGSVESRRYVARLDPRTRKLGPRGL